MLRHFLIFAFMAMILTSCVAKLPVEYVSKIDDIDNIATPYVETEDYRLPDTIIPEHYSITWKPYLLESTGEKRFTFEGEVFIEIKPKVETNSIVLHSKDLNYTLCEYWSLEANNVTKSLGEGVLNNVTDKLSFTLTEDLKITEVYVLHFKYTGKLGEDNRGLFRTAYNNTNGEVVWIVATQFEINHARRAYPSFDEPKFKAHFNLTIVRPLNWKTQSNTRLINSVRDLDDNIWDTYEQTPKMSTYLLAVSVNDFIINLNDDFGVIARPAYFEQTFYSFDKGQKILQALGDFLNISYNSMGNDKLYMIGIPGFAGAMENWGLVTYRESLLLHFSRSTRHAEFDIVTIIAHELAHMWFGNLVTCSWWSHTWLNEGFAQYLQYYGAALVETSWELEKQFVVDQQQSIMGMDAMHGSNPLTDEDTNSPADLSRMFNSITYVKGASFIRMVSHVLGGAFQQTLQQYLDQNRHESTEPEHILSLWRAAFPTQYIAHADSFFQSFTEQVGYPVVTITTKAGQNYFEIKQARFLLKENDGSNKSLLYTVPITFTSDIEKDFVNTQAKLFLPQSTAATEVPLGNAYKWIIGNIQSVGYYRVNYDEQNWNALKDALHETNWGGIHELNRAQIVDDILNFARADLLSYELALSVVDYLRTETNYLPWTAALNAYDYLAIRMGSDYTHFDVYIRQLMGKAYIELNFEEKSSDSTLQIFLRSKILSWTCRYYEGNCISRALEYFESWKNEQKEVPVNIQEVVYCVAMRQGSEADFDFLLEKYKTLTIATDSPLLLKALGCVKNATLVNKYFAFIQTDYVRRVDKATAIAALYSQNAENVSPVFQLIREQFEQLAESMGGFSAVATLISNLAVRFTEQSQLTDLNSFNNANKDKFGSAAVTLENAETIVAENLEWDKAKVDIVRQQMLKLVRGGATATTISVLTLLLSFFIAKLIQ